MRKLTDGLLGVITRDSFRLEVWKTNAPKQNGLIRNGDYCYLTKINHNGEIGERSIGLPISDLSELIAILEKANSKF